MVLIQLVKGLVVATDLLISPTAVLGHAFKRRIQMRKEATTIYKRWYK